MGTSAYARDLAEVPGAERIAPGLWLLGGRPRHRFNVYVMGDVLVDAGSRHAARRILRQVGDLPLRAHALTHAHMDHMGASHEVCSALGLPYLCGEADVPAAETGGRAGLSERPLPLRVMHRLVAGEGHQVSDVLREGATIGGFAVLEVPGHSPGHVAFWRESDRVLVLGDVLFNMRTPSLRAGLQLPPGMLTPDPERNLRSAERLADLDPQVVCFGHGPPLRDGEAFRAFVATAK